MNSRNAAAIAPARESTLAQQPLRHALRRASATSAPNSARISTQSSIEPSWFHHTPEIL